MILKLDIPKVFRGIIFEITSAKDFLFEYIMRMSNIASTLKALKLEMLKGLLIHLVSIYFLYNLASLTYLITFKRRNGLLIS